MRTFILFFLLMIILGAGLQLVLPWWSIALLGAVLGYFFQLRPVNGFLYGFLAAATLWGLWSGWLSMANDNILAGRLATLFGGLPPLAMALITAVFGGLLGGLGALTGSLGKGLVSA